MSRLVLMILFTLAVPTVLYGQSLGGNLSLEIIPTNPEPGKNVTVRATSFDTNLNSSNISWTYNGKSVRNGVGLTSIVVVAPSAGNSAVVSATASGSGLSNQSASISIRPASVDMLWEAVDAYTPPFYKGKALLPIGGAVKLSAIPSSSAPKSLIYNWSRNGSFLQEASGYNKSSIVFTQNILNPQERVDLEINSGAYSGSSSIRLNPIDPTIVLYENNEGYIDLNTGYKNNIYLNKPGILFRFEPYFFSIPRNVLADLKFTTKLDGEEIHSQNQNEVGFSKPDHSGRSTMEIAVRTVNYSLQNIDKLFNLTF